MDDISADPVALLLRGIHGLGRRLRTSRSERSRPLAGLSLLGTLHRVGPLVATRLAAEEGLQPQSLTRLLADLEKDGLLSRKRSEDDGRANTLTITAKGRRLLLDEIAERRAWLDAAMASTLTPAERDTLKAAASVLLKVASHQPREGIAMTMHTDQPARPAIADRDLSGATYSNVRLENATFRNVNLKRAGFSDINFAGATFSNVNLSHVSISDACLEAMSIDGVLVTDLLRLHHDQQRRHARAEPNGGEARSNAVFHVRDLTRSLEYYTRLLGFETDFVYGRPATYAGLRWKNVELHISSSYPYKDNTGHGNLYIRCDAVDDLYRKLVAEGAEFYSPISDRDYGMRDFAIKDPDGNQIGFGAPTSG